MNNEQLIRHKVVAPPPKLDWKKTVLSLYSGTFHRGYAQQDPEIPALWNSFDTGEVYTGSWRSLDAILEHVNSHLYL